MSGTTDTFNVIVPTRSPASALHRLVEQIMATAGVPVTVHVTGRPGSASVNRNAGLDMASGAGVVAMVDDDIEFVIPESLRWLKVMVDALLRPEVVMVSAQLYQPDGFPAYMTGLQDCGLLPQGTGETVVPSRRLLTACCAFKPSGCRFDEAYVGSGFEDCDYCNQLVQARPDGVFLVCHDARVIHRNEQKRQGGRYWAHNRRHFEAKWGRLESREETLERWGPSSTSARAR